MADDVEITAGSGTPIATEDVAGVHHQKVKVEFGGDGAATLVSNADPLPVVITGPDGTEVSVSEGNALNVTLEGAGGAIVQGLSANGTPGVTVNPLITGGVASATAPTPVDEDDAVHSWMDLSGAQAVFPTVGGALIGGDATNGLDVDVTRSALPTGAATAAKQDAEAVLSGAVTEAAPASDTASSGLNGRLQRIAQRLTSIIALLPTALGAGGGLKVDGSGTALPVSGTVTANAGTNLNTSALATEAGGNLAAQTIALQIMDDWDESDRAKVNPIAGQAGVQGASGTVTALTQRVVLATDVALPAGTNAIGKLAANTGVDIGDVDVTSVVPGTGATNLGKAEDAAHTTGDVGVQMLAVRTDTPATKGADNDYHPLQTNSVGGQWVSEVADPAGGCSVFKSLDLDETEEDVKTSPGCVYGWYVFNNRSTKVYLKFYNATAASVTVGTTTPVMTFPIPAGETVGVAANMGFAPGILFGTAICVAATTGAADNDTGAPAAGDCIVNIFYK